MKRIGWSICIALCFAVAARAQISATVLSPTKVELTSPGYHVVADNGNFTISILSSDPAIGASRFDRFPLVAPSRLFAAG